MAVVLLVWGIIGYKFVSALNPTIESNATAVIADKFVPKEIKEREQFTIVAEYRDPFLGTIKNPASNRKKKVSIIVKKDLPKKNIVYTGFITDKGSKQKIFFVTIDGQQQMMGLKDTFKEVKLIQGTNSYIKVSYNGISEKIILAQ
ncbi:hypothetical protein [Maribacter caenipelagi]|uniref:hypothetical protein n=1 Tax=Maribacter caenipelagi TaxID=1447781 RepID=UPI001AAE3861|nr:hypothetical protein [Maribacter caenipelagi]